MWIVNCCTYKIKLVQVTLCTFQLCIACYDRELLNALQRVMNTREDFAYGEVWF